MEIQTLDNQSKHQTTSISLYPIEIIQEILSRLPIKPLLQFNSVSKQWLSLISDDPSLSKLHFTRSIATNRTALLFSAYDSATRERHFLSAPPDGGPLTHLITLDNAPSLALINHTTEAQHLNGLVLFTSISIISQCNFAFVINPATRKVFQLPVPTEFVPCSYYFFGFHQSRNEHYVLSVSKPTPYCFNSKSPVDVTDIIQDPLEFMIYSLSTYSWRKIDVKEEELPIDIIRERWHCGPISSVCVNSVIHLMLETCNRILAFDLTTEKFSTIYVPQDAIPREMSNVKPNHPLLMDIDGCLGLVSHDHVVERNKIYFWILQDYDGRVWVKETVTISESWFNLNVLFPINFGVDMYKIVFLVHRLSWDVVTLPIYDMKTKGFQRVQFTPGQDFLRSKTMEFGEVTSYVESILPLKKNEDGLHEDDK